MVLPSYIVPSSLEYYSAYYVPAACDEFDRVPAASQHEVDPNLVVSKIEQVKLIIIRMLTLADGIERTDVKSGIEELNKNTQEVQDFAAKAGNSGRSFSIGPTALTSSRQFEADTYFDDQAIDNTPIQIRHIAREIFSKLAKLFLGQDAFNRIRKVVEQRLPLLAKLFWGQKTGTENLQTLAQQQEGFDEHRNAWTKSIKPYLNAERDFQNNMDRVFYCAEKLLEQKKENEEKAYTYRITFYATLAFSIVGRLIDQRAISILGLAGSAIIFFLMNQYYDNSSSDVELKEALTLKTEASSLSTVFQRVKKA